MNKIVAKNVGKQFGREWIFKNFSFEFLENQSYAIIGSNGSGKSTLMKILTGMMPATMGEVDYVYNEKKIDSRDWFKDLAIAAPYLELVEEFSLKEMIDFHTNFKKLSVKREELIKILGFQKSTYKPIKFFSSGMKQKLKLALAMYAKSKVLFLDEPTANLDEKNIDWYVENIKEVSANKVVIICSNQQYEYNFCNQIVNLMLFK
ncbi:ABC transporter ATP-binding protein [Thermoflexibacter ruber]|uniref:ABC transporter n=1 Tax=Thermoflexibacter ruber TaxID=1003 RepID=A0A1I2F3Z3_9BACT|nr:ABC transporter ATP-binding protein [Thermoflexibacter ruber]SFE99241.1 ABC transporter [Thermoflexibacter ruber]